MKWKFRIGSLLGIPVYIHATFPLLLAWIGMTQWLQERNLGETVDSVVFVLAIFGCVVLHELGHAVAARRYGIRTRDVTLVCPASQAQRVRELVNALTARAEGEQS